MTIVRKITIWMNLFVTLLLSANPVFANVEDSRIDTGTPWTGKLKWDFSQGNIFGKGDTDVWKTAENIIWPLIVGITGLLTIVSVLVFSFKAVALAKSGDNPNERQKAIQGIIYSIIAFALLGGTSLIITIFKNMSL